MWISAGATGRAKGLSKAAANWASWLAPSGAIFKPTNTRTAGALCADPTPAA